MKVKISLFLIAVLFSFNQNFAQSKKVADKLFKKYSYPKAVKIYKSLYRQGDKSEYIIRRIAESYYKNSQTKESEIWYQKLVDNYRENVTDAELFRYAQSLRSNGNFTKSDSLLAIVNHKSVSEVKKKTNYLLDSMSTTNKRISIRNLAVNTEYSDFGGFLLNDEVYFASASPTSYDAKKYEWNNQPYLNLYKSNSGIIPLEDTETDSILVLERRKILPNTINTAYHESNAILTKDGKTMYFSRVNSDGRKRKRSRDNTVNLKIYKTNFVEGKWSKPIELPFCSDEYSVGHPALSEDEKTMFFTSDMPGAVGETDIFKVSINDGEFGEPVNLGKTVNTLGKEMFPFIGSDGTLYFSSNGHIGFGLLDIFQTQSDDNGNYSKPKNLGFPFNSNKDDFAFYIYGNGHKGFFSSNRPKGKGDDDIYSFVIYVDLPTQFISGFIKDSKANAPIANSTVKLFDSDGNLVTTAVTDDKGYYKSDKFPKQVGDLTVVANKKDYKEARKEFSLNADHGKEIKVGDLKQKSLIKENQIEINSINFDYDSAVISEDSALELEYIISVMENHPNMIIKIESHSDSRGKAKYNLKLSDLRAKSTRDYILSRGIDKKRIVSAIGYGETQLLNHCDDKHIDKCTEEEHAVNRRSYFYIISGADDVKVKNKNKIKNKNKK